MDGKYNVVMNGMVVGYAEVKTEGLYMRIIGRCKLSRLSFCRLIAVWDDICLDLGICLPDRDGLAISTKIPIKRAGQGTPAFKLEEKNARQPFAILEPGESFLYIQKLDAARFSERSGRYGIEFLT